ncbi:hypothetical protein DYB28_004809 [Aphanomyces astaci]|uniref:Peptidase A2 domain-containing protein n=2 Tax=Aphanomyces astaci TaxID=112090 RepID=A0A397E308_APHAT|nr:hypothetical protein DYB30_009786 [Aphanomyces astaci]RHY80089.1 hypothetical protein DYB31_007976 [Aphanomyces astaci]RHZ13620.1 hypothetical protein DYB26_010715 [Aphanomyces astaci]RLO02608.1 hypothetical protein DYB28_004809 [Aphanomyces astaci]
MSVDGSPIVETPWHYRCRVKKLMDDFHQARRRSVNFVSSTKPANSMKCQASIEDVITLPQVLLDSGSDETLVSEGRLVALERLGVSLNVETKPRLMLKPYGETTKPLHVTRQVQLKTVMLETSIGQLVLRGFRAWVEKKEMEIDVLRATFSRRTRARNGAERRGRGAVSVGMKAVRGTARRATRVVIWRDTRGTV